MKKLHDSRPCRICGLAPKIRLSEHGQYCLYYGIRITDEEANNRSSSLRLQCLSDGNHFVWPLRGLTAIQLLQWRRDHMDWHLKRLSLKAAIWVGATGLLITTISLIANIF